MSSRKESSCTNQNTLTTSMAKIGAAGNAVNSPRNLFFQNRQQPTPTSSSASIYNIPQRRLVNLDQWPGNAGNHDNDNNVAMAQMYSSRWGIYDNTSFNIGYNDGGFSKLPPLNMNGLNIDNINNLDQNQFSPKHTMLNNASSLSPNNFMQQNMNNNAFATTQTTNSNTLNNSIFHQSQQNQQNLNTHINHHQNHQINVTMHNSNTTNFQHHQHQQQQLQQQHQHQQQNPQTNVSLHNTTSNFQHQQQSTQPCIDLNNFSIDKTTNFHPQHTIQQNNTTDNIFHQNQQNMNHQEILNNDNDMSNFQQKNNFNQFLNIQQGQQQTQIDSAMDSMNGIIPQSLVDIVMELEEEMPLSPEHTLEQTLTDYNKNIQNSCSYGNSPIPESYNNDSMMDIVDINDSNINDIYTNIPSIRPPATWNFDIVENNKIKTETSNIQNLFSNELKKEDPNIDLEFSQTEPVASNHSSASPTSPSMQQQDQQNHQQHMKQNLKQSQQSSPHQQLNEIQHTLEHNQQSIQQNQQQNMQQNQQNSQPNQPNQQQNMQQNKKRIEKEEDDDIPNEIFDKNGETFLHLAIHNRDIKQCLEILETPVLNKAINVKNASKEVPILILLKKCFTKCDKVLDKFLEFDVSVKAIDHSANNIFHLTISEALDESQCLQILDVFFKYAKYKEDYKWLMNQRNISGYTPGHIATIRGYGKALWKFHDNEANLDLQDFQAQKTCLVMAAENKNWPLVTELIKMNVNVNVAARGDQRAINYAIKSSRADIISLLFEHDTECLKWKDIVPSEEIEKLVRKLIRKKRRKKKEGKVERND